MRRRTWFLPPAIVAMLFAFWPPAADAWFILLPVSLVAALVIYRREREAVLLETAAQKDDKEKADKVSVLDEQSTDSSMVRVIESPSWGAAVTIIVYLIAMRVYKNKAALIWLIALFIAPLIWAVLIIFPWSYFVLKGKQIAWETREWKDYEDFLACQRIWDRWSKGVLVAIAVAIVLSSFF